MTSVTAPTTAASPPRAALSAAVPMAAPLTEQQQSAEDAEDAGDRREDGEDRHARRAFAGRRGRGSGRCCGWSAGGTGSPPRARIRSAVVTGSTGGGESSIGSASGGTELEACRGRTDGWCVARVLHRGVPPSPARQWRALLHHGSGLDRAQEADRAMARTRSSGRDILESLLDPGRAHPSGADLRPMPPCPRRARRRKEATVTSHPADPVNARATLRVGDRSYEYFRARPPPALRTSNACRTRSRCCSRTCCAARRRSPDLRQRRSTCARSPLGSDPAGGGGAAVHAGAGHPPGLHGRAVRGRPRRHARRDGRHGRRPVADQPARAGRPGHRPLASRSTSSAATPRS